MGIKVSVGETITVGGVVKKAYVRCGGAVVCFPTTCPTAVVVPPLPPRRYLLTVDLADNSAKSIELFVVDCKPKDIPDRYVHTNVRGATYGCTTKKLPQKTSCDL